MKTAALFERARPRTRREKEIFVYMMAAYAKLRLRLRYEEVGRRCAQRKNGLSWTTSESRASRWPGPWNPLRACGGFCQ